MTDKSTSSGNSGERLPVPEGAIVEKTDGGGLVFMETQPGVKELIGFIDITSTDVLADELRQRNIDTRAVHDTIRFPTFNSPNDM